jgi:hypothetical protein
MRKAEAMSKLRRAAGELLIIVVGVLTALALNGWNAKRQERALEEVYLRSLAADLATQVDRFDGWLTAFDARAGVAEQVWSAVTTGVSPRLTPEDLFDALLSGGTYHPPRLYSDATYQDLISTGNLRLIRDQELRSAILDYHSLRTQYLEWIDELARESSTAWNRSAEGLMPAALISARRTGEGLAEHDLETVLAEFRKREAVRASLARTLARYDDERYFADVTRDSARSLIARIEAALPPRR